MIDSKKYLIAFLITALIFGTAIYLSNFLSDKKIDNVKAIESRVALDILALETQFALLGETSCQDIGPGFLSKELGSLGERLSYAENNAGFNQSDVDYLKSSYFLLEIKDYLLMKELTEKCGTKPTFILYFYSSEKDCPDCERMGFVLTALRNKYPDLRVYSFDYHFDLEAVRTLSSIFKVEPNLPALVVGNQRLYGFRGVEELEEAVPALRLLDVSESYATSTEEAL